MGPHTTTPLTTENIDAILRFLPLIEAPGFTFGSWHSEEGTFPYFSLSDVASEFYQALYKHNWIIAFDWGAWEEGKRIFREHPTTLGTLDLETLRKLLTAHVRQDRFCEGHLESVWNTGHLLAILHRLEELRGT